MPIYWRETLPIIVDRANALCRTKNYGAAKEHFLLAAEMANIADLRELERLQLFAAWYCEERVQGRQPTELP